MVVGPNSVVATGVSYTAGAGATNPGPGAGVHIPGTGDAYVIATPGAGDANVVATPGAGDASVVATGKVVDNPAGATTDVGVVPHIVVTMGVSYTGGAGATNPHSIFVVVRGIVTSGEPHDMFLRNKCTTSPNV